MRLVVWRYSRSDLPDQLLCIASEVYLCAVFSMGPTLLFVDLIMLCDGIRDRICLGRSVGVWVNWRHGRRASAIDIRLDRMGLL